MPRVIYRATLVHVDFSCGHSEKVQGSVATWRQRLSIGTSFTGFCGVCRAFVPVAHVRAAEVKKVTLHDDWRKQGNPFGQGVAKGEHQ